MGNGFMSDIPQPTSEFIPPNPNLLNTALHPFDATSILNWLIERWQEDHDRELIVITFAGDGKNLIGRVRVRLSDVRNSILNDGLKFEEFGIKTTPMKWDELDAVAFVRVKNASHHVKTMFSVFDNLLGE